MTILDLMERQGHSPEVVAADLAWAAASLVRTTQRELGLRTTPDPTKRSGGFGVPGAANPPNGSIIRRHCRRQHNEGQHDEHHRPRQRARQHPEVTWEPPGPGHWELDLSHCLGSMTPIMQDIQGTGATNGMRELFALYGMPADTLDARFVNGYFYTRIRPCWRPTDRPRRLPLPSC